MRHPSCWAPWARSSRLCRSTVSWASKPVSCRPGPSVRAPALRPAGRSPRRPACVSRRLPSALWVISFKGAYRSGNRWPTPAANYYPGGCVGIARGVCSPGARCGGLARAKSYHPCRRAAFRLSESASCRPDPSVRVPVLRPAGRSPRRPACVSRRLPPALGPPHSRGIYWPCERWATSAENLLSKGGV